ncbi:hypothetical protein ACQ4M4_07265 [Leptolyngbya sp. AN02str]|uniref:hypothetical protein n=1 Tax=Leptolyngbya sp. AN02str TaxID=3423363 RepID=UPI003D32038F
MPRDSNFKRPAPLGLAAFVLCFSPFPALAHFTQVAGDIAGTWHIEPNHAPKAGEPAIAWVALTRKGGEPLALSEANCQMAVYTAPRQPDAAPILQPEVQAIAAETYQNIPGAEIVFPAVGLYQLELDCTPQTVDDFAPFQMQYDVTVATAAAPVAASTPNLTANEQNDPNPPMGDRSGVWLGAIALVGVIGVGGWWMFARRA